MIASHTLRREKVTGQLPSEKQQLRWWTQYRYHLSKMHIGRVVFCFRVPCIEKRSAFQQIPNLRTRSCELVNLRTKERVPLRQDSIYQRCMTIQHVRLLQELVSNQAG